MKKMLFLLLPTGIALFMCCKNWDFNGDPKEYPPQGHVLEYGTEKPIPGATVYQSECEGEIFGAINCWTIDSATTDAQGHYAFTIPGGLTVSARAAGYFSSDLQPILSGGATPADLTLYPHAWLRVTIKNESGAYGFGSSQLLDYKSPPILTQQQGQEDLVVKFVKGNKIYKLIFFLLIDANTSSTDTTNVKILDAKGNRLPIVQGVSLSVVLTPVGHDTTKITIIY